MFLWLFVGLVALVALLTATGGWAHVWRITNGPADLGEVDFATLKKTARPNQALVCPPGLCGETDIDMEAPVFDLAAPDLKRHLLAALESEADLERVDDESDPLSLRFIQRTRWMRFPDTIRIRLIELGERRSTLAMYSQSQVGESDLGVNKSRLERWLKKLAEQTGR